MPEIVPAAVSTEPVSSSSSSSSTADIAASVISDMESANDDDDTPVTGATASDDPAVKAAIDPDDFDTTPAERTDALGRKRENAIPHSRVKTMIAKREAKLIATVAKELGITKAEAELQLEDVIGGVKERGTRLTESEERIQQITAVEQVMERDPARFMQMLVTLNPGYAEYARKEAVAAVSAQAVDADPEPDPDYDLGNGQKTYSLDGMRKRDAWKERQITKALETKLGERLKPFEDQRQRDQEHAEVERQKSVNWAQVSKRLERARKWPQFKEHEPDIQKLVTAEHAKGNFISFEDGYMQVVIPKLAGDRTSIRQEVLSEINGQPKSTSVTPAVASKQVDKPKTTADIARELIAQMGG